MSEPFGGEEFAWRTGGSQYQLGEGARRGYIEGCLFVIISGRLVAERDEHVGELQAFGAVEGHYLGFATGQIDISIIMVEDAYVGEAVVSDYPYDFV